MKRTLLLTCAFMLAIAGAAVAQTADTVTPAPAAPTALATSTTELSVSGKVVSSTATELVIDSDAGQRMTFALDGDTTPATSFTAGERVTVQYHTLSGGTVYHAATIALLPEDKVEPPVAEVAELDSLPNTASGLPLLGLLGLLAVGGAVTVRMARQ